MHSRDELRMPVEGINPEAAIVPGSVPKSWLNELRRMFRKIAGRSKEHTPETDWHDQLSWSLKRFLELFKAPEAAPHSDRS